MLMLSAANRLRRMVLMVGVYGIYDVEYSVRA